MLVYTYLAYIPLPEGLRDILDEYAKDVKDELGMLSIPRLTPHTTLMRMNCEAAEEDAIVERLEEIDHERVGLKPNGLEKFSQSALVLTMEQTEELQVLHREVAEAFAERMARPNQRVKPEYQDRVETIQRYGSPFFGEHYEPHMTIGYTGNSLDDVDLPGLPPVSFEASEFVLSKKEEGSGKPYTTVGRYEFA